MNKYCIGFSVILMVIIMMGVYKFVLDGNTASGTDDRVAIMLTESEKNLVLGEMRLFLESVQKITQGISENNMQLVSEYATKVGKANQAQVPGVLMGKLPASFKVMGFETHSKFDQLALDAAEFGDRDTALTQLSELMTNCTACHSIYRIDIEN